ncbi:hypothetical protein TOT_010000400 [Theileria orientalis strain Shintoku]|uniref:Uncharacterized protein n=1 Tax=Theileria orientalis strain Shintoku TaxID=869250 RepID=J4D5F9_THEOR|nr:hypothetical protein TOT_010000400 [Theileria orientalis strain Shintoku]BAM38935.1 hypothetical protein TOT_010000400 [Theileria orientalis strain Shintoku]|eukprot:XP_009689236.1 hypothetical protein TOT_010000400 [Theileria orientalis strain Shintoku]
MASHFYNDLRSSRNCYGKKVFWLCNSRDVNIFKILTRVRSKCPILGRFPEAKRSGSMLNAFKPVFLRTYRLYIYIR